MRNPRVGMMLVAAAGPAANIVMAVAAGVALGVIGGLPLGPATRWLVSAPEFLWMFIRFNLSLAVFNLLPIPPFDGSHIVAGLLPSRAAQFIRGSIVWISAGIGSSGVAAAGGAWLGSDRALFRTALRVALWSYYAACRLDRRGS
jgi:Zn-dependent protease